MTTLDEARAALETGDRDGAASLIRRASSEAPRNDEVLIGCWRLLGEVVAAKGDAAGAQICRTAADAPHDREWLSALVRFLGAIGLRDMAIPAAERLVDLHPADLLVLTVTRSRTSVTTTVLDARSTNASRSLRTRSGSSICGPSTRP